MFKFNPKGQYMMPAHFGYRLRGRGPAPKYHDVTNMTVTYLTDREMLSQYLPELFEIGEEPQVYVTYTMNREGEWRTSGGLRGHRFIDMEVMDLKPVPQAEIDESNKGAGQGNWMGWLYVPKIGEAGPSVSHATGNPAGGITKEAWAGTGKLEWHRQTWEQNPAQCHIINALADLSILEYRSARVAKMGTSLETATRTVREMYQIGYTFEGRFLGGGHTLTRSAKEWDDR